jgi:hypothetical protein
MINHSDCYIQTVTVNYIAWDFVTISTYFRTQWQNRYKTKKQFSCRLDTLYNDRY